MKINLLGLLLIVVALVISGRSYSMDQPNVEYSADTVMEHEGGAMKGKIYFAPGKERREMAAGAENMVNITRHDKKVTWMLMPEEKMFMEMKQSAGAPPNKDDMSGYTIEQSIVGPETMNGVETTKSKIIMTGKDSTKFGGFMWTTKEGIMVKLDAIAIDKNSKARFKTELTNLKVGKQDPALFEIPQGFKRMDMPGMDMDAIKNMMK